MLQEIFVENAFFTFAVRAALLAAWCGLLANSAFIDTLHWRHLWIVAGLIYLFYTNQD